MTSGMKIRMQMCVWTNNIKIYENSRLIYGNSRLKRTSNNQALTRLFYRSRVEGKGLKADKRTVPNPIGD